MLASVCAINSSLTQEQREILEHFLACSSSVAVEARAGTGKTFAMIEMAAHLSGNQRCAFLVFNSHVVHEIIDRLKRRGAFRENYQVLTTYALGNRALFRKFGKLEIDERKYFKIINERFAKKEYESIFDSFSFFFKDVRFFKFVLKRWVDLFRVHLVENAQEMAAACRQADVFYHPTAFSIASDVVRDGKTMLEKNKVIDFIDMIYFPIRMNLSAKQSFECVFLDEFQDYSLAQYKLVRKHLVPMGKMIIIGDPYQSIYGFNGARFDLMDKAIKENNCQKFKLTVTFRCSKKIVDEARFFVNDIVPLSSAEDGEVIEGSVLDAGPGDWVICKYNFPLFKLFADNAKKQKKCFLKNKDYGEFLFEMSLPFAKPDWNSKLMLERFRKETFDFWERLNEKRREDDQFSFKLLIEKIDIYKSLEYFFETLKDQVFSSEEEFKEWFMKPFVEFDSDSLLLSTIHKVKGKENDCVYVLAHSWEFVDGRRRLKSDKDNLNLNYVAVTRAKKKLVYDFDYFSKTSQPFKDLFSA